MCHGEVDERERKRCKSLQFVIEALTRPGAGIVDAYVFTCINHFDMEIITISMYPLWLL
jgi:hypothetical protein